MSAPGVYLMNASGELTPLVTEDGGGDENLLAEVVNGEMGSKANLALIDPDYKPAHERRQALVVNDSYEMDSATPLFKFIATESAFNLGYGVIGSNQREWERSVDINDPDAARELAAHLLAWADHKESVDD